MALFTSQLQQAIFQAVKKIGFKDIDEHKVNLAPAPPYTGADFASNIALVLGEKEKKDPKEVARSIINELKVQKTLGSIIERIEVAGAGFINVRASSGYLREVLQHVFDQGEAFGKSDELKGKKIIIEFTDPNPFKEFHIGHLYSNTVGEALARLLESQGALVKRANYQGDVGMHVAKALWGMQRKLNHTKFEELEKLSLNEKAKFLGEAYALGAKAYEEDESAKKEIDELNKKIYKLDPSVKELYEHGRKWSLDYFKNIYRRLGTKFDFSYFERETGKEGLVYVKKYLEKGVFHESKGAIVFEGEKYGLHTRVFINSQGLPTYEAKDLALAATKYKDFPYDESIIVTGSEQDEYFKVVLAALRETNPALGVKTKHISHGFVRLPEGRMASRKGNIITGARLLDEVKKNIVALMERSSEIMGKQEKEEVAKMVSVGAVKYSLLKSSLGKDIIFYIDESINLEGNSAPYLQYTYARTKSVISKAGINVRSNLPKEISPNEEERAVASQLVKFPFAVMNAVLQYAPHLLCSFLFGLAQVYNNFYSKHRIIGSENEVLRLILTTAVGQVLKNGLHLLGIQTPQRM